MGKGETRRQFTAEQKYKVVKEVLTTDSTVSEVCKKYGIGTNLYYRWQQTFLESALIGFKTPKGGANCAQLTKIEQLERDNQRLKNVIAEVTAENIEFKKNDINF